MKARILSREDVLKITDLLRQQGYEVMARIPRPWSRYFLRSCIEREPRPDRGSTCPIPTIRRSAMSSRRSNLC